MHTMHIFVPHLRLAERRDVQSAADCKVAARPTIALIDWEADTAEAAEQNQQKRNERNYVWSFEHLISK